MQAHRPDEYVGDPQVARELLIAGNGRYLKGELSDKGTYASDREIFKDGQKPFAAILCCSDSRVSPDTFFDARPGDLFVVRNAGNVADATVLGSIEYAVEHLGVRLVLVCSHSSCGAVTAALNKGHGSENLASLLARIQSGDSKDVREAAGLHADATAKAVQGDLDSLGLEATVISALFDIHTGEVIWR